MTDAARLYAVASRRPTDADAELLAAWAGDRDADAFAELVRRYGPLVWHTCRATAGDTPAAEDAFQATFLALARRADGVTAVAGFLHRTAGRAARKAARRDRHVSPAPPTAPDPLDRLTARELLAAVDAEIARLPEGQRLAVLLCGADGLSPAEAARRLGWSAGAVRGRLQRGRAALRARLAAKGLAVPAVVGLGVVPERLTAATVATVCRGPVPAAVARLVPGGLAMTGLKLALVAGVLGGLIASTGQPATDPPRAEPMPEVVLWEGKPDGAAFGIWHPDGKHALAVGTFEPGKPAEVRAWDAATGTLVKTFALPETHDLRRGLETLAVNENGETVAAGLQQKKGTGEGAVALWAWDNPDEAPGLLPLNATAASLCFSRSLPPPHERLFVVTSFNGKAEQRLLAFRLRGDPKPAAEVALPNRRTRNTPTADHLTYHPNRQALVTTGSERLIFWRPDTLEVLDTAYYQAPLWNYPFSLRPDGRRLTLFGESGLGADRRLLLGGFDLHTEHGLGGERHVAMKLPVMTAPLPSADGKEWGLNHLGYSPDGRFLALAGKDDTARIADAVSAQVVAEWREAGPVRAAHFAPDGRRLLTVARGAVRVRDVADKLAPRPPDLDLRLTHEKELDRFAGRWVVSVARIDGKEAASMIGGGMSGQIVAVDPAVSPKAANVRREAGPDAGELRYAIYEFLDPDTYRICYSRDPDRRPTAFTADRGSRQSLFTLTRAK